MDTCDGGDRVPVYDRLYLGGASNLRGFGFRKVGPLDYKGNPVGGRTLVRYTAEYTYPVINRVRGAFFTDGGYVNQDDFDFTPQTLLRAQRLPHRSRTRSTTTPRRRIPNQTGNDLNNMVFGGGFNADVGFGVRLDLPIGPVRLDYGYPSAQQHVQHPRTAASSTSTSAISSRRKG